MVIMKKGTPLILGIFIPVLALFCVAIAIYLPFFLPNIFVPPKHNFVYAINMVHPANESLAQGEQPKSKQPSSTSDNFFIYDVLGNSSRPISSEKLAALRLDPNVQSEDGFSVVRGGGSNPIFIFGFSRDCCAYYIKSSRYAKELNIPVEGSDRHFRFLGWIEN